MSITTTKPITTDELVRITGMNDIPPVETTFAVGLTVQDALANAGVELPSGHAVIVNGRQAQLTDAVEADTTLVVAPRIANG